MNIIVSTAVWGKDYIKIFADIGLPSIVNQIKMYEKQDEFKFKFLIFSPKKFHPLIHEKVKAFQDKNIEIHYKDLKLVSLVNRFEKSSRYKLGKYNVHSETFNETLNLADKTDIIILNYADFIWSDNLIRLIIQKLVDNSFDVILNHPLTVDSKEFDNFKSEIDDYKIIKNSFIIEKSLQETDWWYKQYEYLNSRGARYMSLIYWKGYSESSKFYLFRGFHLNLLALRKTTQLGESIPRIEFGTPDGNYYPYQLMELGLEGFFISDAYEGTIATLTNKDSSEFPINEKGFYTANLYRHAKNHHGRNEILNLQKHMIIYEEKFKPEQKIVDDLIQQSEFDTKNLKNLTEMLINTPDLPDLIIGSKITKSLSDIRKSQYYFIIMSVSVMRIILDLIASLRILIYIFRELYRLYKKMYLFLKLNLRLKWKKYFNIKRLNKNISQNELVRMGSYNIPTKSLEGIRFEWMRALKRGNSVFYILKIFRINELFKLKEKKLQKRIEQIINFYNEY